MNKIIQKLRSYLFILGLFARVVLMSGSALSPWAIARNAENYSIKLAKELNCETYVRIINNYIPGKSKCHHSI